MFNPSSAFSHHTRSSESGTGFFPAGLHARDKHGHLHPLWNCTICRLFRVPVTIISLDEPFVLRFPPVARHVPSCSKVVCLATLY